MSACKTQDCCKASPFDYQTDALDGAYVHLTVSPADSGSVSGNGLYDLGAIANLIATPAGGWTFTGWYDEALGLISASATYNLTVQSNRTITAQFDPS